MSDLDEIAKAADRMGVRRPSRRRREAEAWRSASVVVIAFGFLAFFGAMISVKTRTPARVDTIIIEREAPPAPVPTAYRQTPVMAEVERDEHAGMIWVNGYTRKDGRYVQGYWRRR